MTTVVICVDGLDPEYLAACETPHLDDLGRRGFSTVGRCMMPSVTNVNNVSVVTGLYPESHGISSNYRLVRETGEEVYMESGDYILSTTLFQKAASLGMRSALVTAKDKLRTLLSDGATSAVSSERPPRSVVEAVGPPPEIYSLEVNGWVIRAASHLMDEDDGLDVVYAATTDYAMHTFAPHEPESQRHMTILDDAIGRLAEAHPDATVLITADHGMSQKTRMVDLGAELARRGIGGNPVPIIKDRYTVHHSNLGGCIFIYLERPEMRVEAVGALREVPGVELVLAREEAASLFRLHADRIGDVVVTGDPVTVFGDPSEVAMPRGLRSHGSAHERRVPIIGYNGYFDGFTFAENRDVGRYVHERLLE